MRRKWGWHAVASHETLTPREREVLKEIVGGSSNKEIGRDLRLSVREPSRRIALTS